MLPRRSARNQNKNVEQIPIEEEPKISKAKHKLESKANAASVKNAKQNVASKDKEPSKKRLKTTKKDDIHEDNAENDDNAKNNKPSKGKAKTTEKGEIHEEDAENGTDNAKSIYEFTATKINGEEVSLEDYKGHVCIIVNVASKCGHTKSNYEQFVELYDKYSEDKGLKILAFPCNQFGKQEPGTAEKICEFVAKRNVKFDMFDKIDVNGTAAHPLWVFLKSKIAGPKGSNIDWNFTKFIVDKEGNVVERHKPSVKPLQLVESLDKYW